MRALVIGADGFAGRWLVRHLVESGDEVTPAVGPHYRRDPLPGSLPARSVDVRDVDAVREIVGSASPEAIYYLAGVSRAGARDDLRLAVGVSVIGAMNVLSAAAETPHTVRLLHIGSSHMYAVPTDGSPITEDSPIRPASVYGAAKAAAEGALLQLGAVADVEVVAIRAFNHIGPGQSADFVVPSLARQVLAIRRGEQEPVVRAGDLDVERDFTDVRDVVRAYRLLARHGEPGRPYNVSSGRPVKIATVVQLLLEIAKVDAKVEADPGRSRADDPPRVVGDATRLHATTGWTAERDLQGTLSDTLTHMRSLTGALPRSLGGH